MLSQKVINGYLVHNLLNTGGRSEVYECVNLLNAQRFALKSVKYHFDFDHDILNEQIILSKLAPHNNLIHSIEDFSHLYNGEKYHIFILPLFEADLQSVKLEKLKWQDKLKIIKEIVAAIRHLHSFDVFHGDIKPANVLVRETSGIILTVIADFSLSDNIFLKTSVKNTFPYCTPFDLYNQKYLTTTQHFKALQEACNNENVDLEEYFTIDRKIIEEDGKRSDIFALGLTIVYIILGDSLFCNNCSLKRHTKKNKINRDFFVEKCRAQYLYFLKDPELYLTLWLKDIDYQLFELIRSMLAVNPKSRPTIEEVEQVLCNH